MLPDFKKQSFSYAKCPAGDLHTGEILSLVCVDAKCQKRGLICPICRANNHEDHEVLPLKIFIDEVKKLFLQTEDAESLNSMSDYLRSIDDSRKELLGILRTTAESIAQELKSVEEKIQENYLAIRKNILAQSTISTKLPIFLENLLKKQENDPYELQEEFQKYGELIKFENSVMKISDKAKKIVEDYSALPKQIKSVLEEQTEIIKNGFKDLLSEKVKANKKGQEAQVFSSELKNENLILSADKKEISNNTEEEGLVYVHEEKTSENRKITFKVNKVGTCIYLGVGLPKMDQDLAFIFGGPILNQHYLLTSSGYNDDEESIDSEEVSKSDFQFEEPGSEITVELVLEKSQIVFSNTKTGMTKVKNFDGLSEESKKELQFCVSLGMEDSVSIV